MRLLLVEDDELLGDGLKAGLSLSGYTVEWLKDGRSADSALQNNQFDLVVLDIGLPDHSGLEVLKRLRKRNNDIPVLLLTARDTIEDKVSGLDCGADDYLIKPFDLDELCARLRAIQRRHSGHSSPVLIHGDLTLDPAAHSVKLGNEQLRISAHEFTLLHYLRNQNQNVSAGFIHLPALPEQAAEMKGSVPSMSLETMMQGIRLVIQVITQE